MLINFQKTDDNLFTVTFEDKAISLELIFHPNETVQIEKIIQCKGLLHSRPINGLNVTVVLDKEGVLSLNYKDGVFYVKMEHNSTRFYLPVGKEVYSRLEFLLNQLLERD